MTSNYDQLPDKNSSGSMLSNRDVDTESESEDEEVKLNCCSGLRGAEDSDMNSSSEDEDESEDEPDAERDGVVNFGKDHVQNGLTVRPKATPPPPSLSPPSREDEESGSDSSSSSSSVGARGVPLSMETSSRMSDAADEDDSDDNELAADDESEEEFEEEAKGEQSDDEGDPEEELSSIMETLEDHIQELDRDAPAVVESFIGVMGDRDDLITIPKPKRVLSFNTLAALNAEAGRGKLSPKRLKRVAEFELGQHDNVLPPLTLGPPAVELDTLPSPCKLRPREGSPVISLSDEELDRQLGEELEDAENRSDDASDRVNTPVPLLTPTHSPLTVDAAASSCEWPSNLTVDSAITAAVNMVPLSSESLKSLDFGPGKQEPVVSARRNHVASDASSLTPLFRGISVGKN